MLDSGCTKTNPTASRLAAWPERRARSEVSGASQSGAMQGSSKLREWVEGMKKGMERKKEKEG